MGAVRQPAPRAPADFYADLIAAVQARGARAILDTSEEALRLGLMARPVGIKPNSEEAAQALGQPVSSDAEHVAAARRLVALLAPATPPAPVVCLTRGARGLLLAAGGELVAAEPPPVTARSPVGAGDATLAGCSGRWPTAAMRPRWRRRAVACGTAAAMQEGTGVGTRVLVDELRVQVKVTPVSFT